MDAFVMRRSNQCYITGFDQRQWSFGQNQDGPARKLSNISYHLHCCDLGFGAGHDWLQGGSAHHRHGQSVSPLTELRHQVVSPLCERQLWQSKGNPIAVHCSQCFNGLLYKLACSASIFESGLIACAQGLFVSVMVVWCIKYCKLLQQASKLFSHTFG